MATDITGLVSRFEAEVGYDDELSLPNLIQFLKLAVTDFNSEAPTGFTLTGTTLDRDATALEQTLIVLMALNIYLRGEAVKWSKLAIVHSNVAGRTKLDGVEFALAKRRTELGKDITAKLSQLTEAGVVAGVAAAELGETLAYAPPHNNPLMPPYI